MAWWLIVLIIVGVLVLLVALYDIVQPSDPIIRNFPVVGHFRTVLSSSGPKLRQYIVAANDEERPFSRDELKAKTMRGLHKREAKEKKKEGKRGAKKDKGRTM